MAMNGGLLQEDTLNKNRAITWRSVLLGLLIGIFINMLTPYNDYVVWNSFVVNSYFPPIATLAVLAIVLLVNGPLHKLAPRFALSPGELSIIMALALVSCSIPSQGLLRQFIPLPVAPIYLTGSDAKYHTLFSKMNLPSWLFAVNDVDKGYTEMSVTKFYTRLSPEESIPWNLWIKPLLGWGIFAIGFFICMVAIACLVRFQWAVNERLAFPIAQLHSLLIAPPSPGKAFNDIFSSKGFWIACLLVVVVHSSEGLHTYFPDFVPKIPYKYDMTKEFSEVPWNYLPEWIKKTSIMFTLLGLSYFTQTKISFSLWGTAILLVIIRWPLQAMGDVTTLSDAALWDQSLGASFAFLAGVIWIGRHHWMMILRSVVGITRPGDARGAYVGYRTAFLAMLLGIGIMIGWLKWMDCSWLVALVSVLMILMAHIITARIVAETGLAYLRVPINMDQILRHLPVTWFTPKDGFFYGMSHYVYMQSARESVLPFTLNALQVIDSTEPSEKDRKRTIPVLSSMIIVGVIAGVMAALYCYYNWAIPLDALNPDGLLNVYGVRTWPQAWLNEFPTAINNGNLAPKNPNPWIHLTVGLIVTIFLQTMSWRFSAWPLLPVGYLLCTSSTAFYVNSAALSLFIGWLAKTIILRFGGSKLFNDLKPVFIGFIFGEALSVGIWLIVTLILAMMNEPFQVVRFMPQ